MELLPIDVSPFFMKRLEELVDKQLGNTYAGTFSLIFYIIEPFWLPVDWKAMKLLDYPKIITYPMDLTTIKVITTIRYHLDKYSTKCIHKHP